MNIKENFEHLNEFLQINWCLPESNYSEYEDLVFKEGREVTNDELGHEKEDESTGDHETLKNEISVISSERLENSDPLLSTEEEGGGKMKSGGGGVTCRYDLRPPSRKSGGGGVTCRYDLRPPSWKAPPLNLTHSSSSQDSNTNEVEHRRVQGNSYSLKSDPDWFSGGQKYSKGRKCLKRRNMGNVKALSEPSTRGYNFRRCSELSNGGCGPFVTTRTKRKKIVEDLERRGCLSLLFPRSRGRGRPRSSLLQEELRGPPTHPPDLHPDLEKSLFDGTNKSRIEYRVSKKAVERSLGRKSLSVTPLRISKQVCLESDTRQRAMRERLKYPFDLGLKRFVSNMSPPRKRLCLKEKVGVIETYEKKKMSVRTITGKHGTGKTQIKELLLNVNATLNQVEMTLRGWKYQGRIPRRSEASGLLESLLRINTSLTKEYENLQRHCDQIDVLCNIFDLLRKSQALQCALKRLVKKLKKMKFLRKGIANTTLTHGERKYGKGTKVWEGSSFVHQKTEVQPDTSFKVNLTMFSGSVSEEDFSEISHSVNNFLVSPRKVRAPQFTQLRTTQPPNINYISENDVHEIISALRSNSYINGNITSRDPIKSNMNVLLQVFPPNFNIQDIDTLLHSEIDSRALSNLRKEVKTFNISCTPEAKRNSAVPSLTKNDSEVKFLQKVGSQNLPVCPSPVLVDTSNRSTFYPAITSNVNVKTVISDIDNVSQSKAKFKYVNFKLGNPSITNVLISEGSVKNSDLPGVVQVTSVAKVNSVVPSCNKNSLETQLGSPSSFGNNRASKEYNLIQLRPSPLQFYTTKHSTFYPQLTSNVNEKTKNLESVNMRHSKEDTMSSELDKPRISICEGSIRSDDLIKSVETVESSKTICNRETGTHLYDLTGIEVGMNGREREVAEHQKDFVALVADKESSKLDEILDSLSPLHIQTEGFLQDVSLDFTESLTYYEDLYTASHPQRTASGRISGCSSSGYPSHTHSIMDILPLNNHLRVQTEEVKNQDISFYKIDDYCKQVESTAQISSQIMESIKSGEVIPPNTFVSNGEESLRCDSRDNVLPERNPKAFLSPVPTKDYRDRQTGRLLDSSTCLPSAHQTQILTHHSPLKFSLEDIKYIRLYSENEFLQTDNLEDLLSPRIFVW